MLFKRLCRPELRNRGVTFPEFKHEPIVVFVIRSIDMDRRDHASIVQITHEWVNSRPSVFLHEPMFSHELLACDLACEQLVERARRDSHVSISPKFPAAVMPEASVLALPA